MLPGRYAEIFGLGERLGVLNFGHSFDAIARIWEYPSSPAWHGGEGAVQGKCHRRTIPRGRRRGLYAGIATQALDSCLCCSYHHHTGGQRKTVPTATVPPVMNRRRHRSGAGRHQLRGHVAHLRHASSTAARNFVLRHNHLAQMLLNLEIAMRCTTPPSGGRWSGSARRNTTVKKHTPRRFSAAGIEVTATVLNRR